MSDPLEKILKTTLTAIESSKEEIFFIAETSRTETLRLTNELSNLKDEIAEVIFQVDFQGKIDRRMRQKLMEVSRAFHKYSEKEMSAAYTEAKNAQINLQLSQSKEKQLRKRRDDLERSLRQMLATIESAENLITKVSMAVNLLQGGIVEALQTKNLEQRGIALRVIRAQEEERRRVAREIHDGPAQMLANIVLRLEIVEKMLEIEPSQVKAELQDLKILVRSNLQDIRRIIFDLRPMALDDLGIVPAIAKYLDNFQENYGITCELRIEGREKQLQPALEVTFFRLIQEGMTNVAKHAFSTKVDVTLVYQESWTIIRIRDYGQGFEVDSALSTPREHFGLIGMRERVEMFSGHFSIQSILGKGTTLELSIPSRHEEERQHDSDSNCR
ncbi:MAG: histidine kinase [Desulfosporosinus sp.]|nr:histidine kinase [Desulfosporosinus sp.]